MFGLLNVVTSTFLESAIESAQRSRDLLVQDKQKSRETYASHLKHIFSEIDADKSGLISVVELDEFLNDDKLELRSYFEALELNANDAHILFKLIDVNGTGEVDFQEFCDGCLQLKGEARSFDINYIIYQNHQMRQSWTQFMTNMDDMLQTIMRVIRPMDSE